MEQLIGTPAAEAAPRQVLAVREDSQDLHKEMEKGKEQLIKTPAEEAAPREVLAVLEYSQDLNKESEKVVELPAKDKLGGHMPACLQCLDTDTRSKILRAAWAPRRRHAPSMARTSLCGEVIPSRSARRRARRSGRM